VTLPGALIGTAVPEPDFDWSWTEDAPAWVAPTIDTSAPSIARIYDYALGGKDHHAIDRATGDRLLAIAPEIAELARANRDFVVRAVTVMAEAGIDQFLDLGCGLPAEPSVHEVARSIVPGARVVYVDHDPIVIAHARAMLDGQPGLAAVHHDIREPLRVLREPAVRELLDLEQPLAVIMGSVLHFVDLSIGAQVVGHYVSKLARGSQVAFSLAARDGVPAEVTREVELVLRSASAPVAFRTRAQVEELMDGLDILPPGIVDVTRWRAYGTPGRLRMHTGVAVKN
jgi:O-methyltransferase involved in polyketide biosynthesis